MNTFDRIYDSANTIKSFPEILQEATYSTRKIFYHISPYVFTAFESNNNYRVADKNTAGVFLSPHLLMIARFANDSFLHQYDQTGRDFFYIYRCLLNKPLNIFNTSNYKDRKKFLDEIKKEPKAFFEKFAMHDHSKKYNSLSELLEIIFKSNDWYVMENPTITNIIQSLGFDGYESTEHKVGNVLVFDAENIDIIGNKYWEKVTKKDIQLEGGIFKKYKKDIDARDEKNTLKNRENSFDKKEFENLDKYRMSDLFDITLTNDRTEQKVKYQLDEYFDSRGEIGEYNFESLIREMYQKFGKDNVTITFRDKVFHHPRPFSDYIKSKYTFSNRGGPF
jgi:hypothetical protein